MVYDPKHGRLHLGRAEELYELIQGDGQPATLFLIDGPYAINKDEWDKLGGEVNLPEFYAPHVEAWKGIRAPASSLYFWNTPVGWATMHPHLEAAGWRFEGLITWHKPNTQRASADAARTWPSSTEVCGFYQCDPFGGQRGSASAAVQYAAGGDDNNWIREFLASEWKAAGLKNRDCDKLLGTAGMAGHYFGKSQWALPKADAFRKMAEHANTVGPARERPYFVPQDVWDRLVAEGGADVDRVELAHRVMRETFADFRSSFDHLRASYEAQRAPFQAMPGLTDVWIEPVVQGAERLMDETGGTLHPCQKPLAFYERKILTSSRPGDLVVEPFGGTCRAAVYLERLGRLQPEAARRYAVSEMDPKYVDAVLRFMAGRAPSPDRRQASLFG